MSANEASPRARSLFPSSRNSARTRSSHSSASWRAAVCAGGSGARLAAPRPATTTVSSACVAA
eukprot:5452550-Lingulodinium_polyedra.AAC.1